MKVLGGRARAGGTGGMFEFSRRNVGEFADLHRSLPLSLVKQGSVDAYDCRSFVNRLIARKAKTSRWP